MDVLKLTYATLEQINSMNDESNGDGSAGGGPMWNRFWNSFGQTASVGGDDNESAVSGSIRPSESTDFLPQTPSRAGAGIGDLSSDLHPNDSASAVGMPTGHDDAMSGSGHPVAGAMPQPAETDDGTYLFKFVTPSGRTHRFQARYDSFETIREIVCIKLAGDPFFSAVPPANNTANFPPLGEEGESAAEAAPAPASGPVSTPDPNDFQLAYTDDDDDLVLVTADGDVQDAVSVARKQGRDRVVLLLQGGRGWEEAAARAGTNAAAAASTGANKRRQREAAEAQLQSVQEEEEREAEAESHGRHGAKGSKGRSSIKEGKSSPDELVFGVLPKDMVLPASIGFLGVAVLAAVVLTRSSSR